MKGCSAFIKAPLLHQIVYCHKQDTFWLGILLCRDTVGVFYNPSRLDCGLEVALFLLLTLLGFFKISIVFLFVNTDFDKHFFPPHVRECPRGVMVKAMDYGIVVREFVLQLRYYVHFRANTLGKGMNPHILLVMG